MANKLVGRQFAVLVFVDEPENGGVIRDSKDLTQGRVYIWNHDLEHITTEGIIREPTYFSHNTKPIFPLPPFTKVLSRKVLDLIYIHRSYISN